jgi:O26-antigen biosynthesis N-acetyl-L-fucosamine transferase
VRILIVGDCYFPTTKSSARVIHDLAKEFTRLGHTSTILVPSEHTNVKLQASLEEGTTVLRIRAGQLKGAPRILRGLREVFLSWTLWFGALPYFRKNPHDLVVFYSPSVFLGPLVAKLKSLWGCPAYLILRDIWPSFLVETGVLHKGPLLRLFQWFEKKQNNTADVIGVQSGGDLKYFQGRHDKEVEILNNWIDSHEVLPPAGSTRERLGLKDKVCFFYGGNFGVAQELQNILLLAERLKNNPDCAFVLLGEGSEKNLLLQRSRDLQLANVHFLSAVPQTQYSAILQEMDVGVLSLNRNFRIQNVPGKFLAYLQAGKPTLASLNQGNDLFGVIRDSHCGFAVESGQLESLHSAALRLATDADLRDSMARNSKRLLEAQFSVQRAAAQILSHFSEEKERLVSNVRAI